MLEGQAESQIKEVNVESNPVRLRTLRPLINMEYPKLDKGWNIAFDFNLF